jgi:hypothetical protein
VQRAVDPISFFIEGIIPSVIAPIVDADDWIGIAVIFVVNIFPLTEPDFLMSRLNLFSRE